jgi:hypothetical protein
MSALLLDASGAAAVLAEMMPFMLGILVLVAVIYGVIFTIFLKKKTPLWRLFGFILALFFAFLGVRVIVGPGNTGMMVIVYFIPLLFGLTTELLMRINQRTT